MNQVTIKKISKKDLVTNLLKTNSDGLTVIEISRILKISRFTADVVLAELYGAKRIRVRHVGMAKLNYWQGEKSKC